jgi:hypothetical protein
MISIAAFFAAGRKYLMAQSRMHPETQTTSTLDPVTGKPIVTVTLDGMSLPLIPIEGKFAQRIGGLVLVQRDLENSLSWLNRAISLHSQVDDGSKEEYSLIKDRNIGNEIKAFFLASVIFYGKAFVSAEGRGSSLSRESLDVEFRLAHDEFLAYRNNFVAHSGSELYEKSYVNVVLMPVDGGAPQLTLTAHGTQPDLRKEAENKMSFVSLIEHACTKAAARRRKLGDKLISRLSKAGLDYWLERARNSEPLNADKLLASKK